MFANQITPFQQVFHHRYYAPINVIPHLPPPWRSGGNGGDLTF